MFSKTRFIIGFLDKISWRVFKMRFLDELLTRDKFFWRFTFRVAKLPGSESLSMFKRKRFKLNNSVEFLLFQFSSLSNQILLLVFQSKSQEFFSWILLYIFNQVVQSNLFSWREKNLLIFFETRCKYWQFFFRDRNLLILFLTRILRGGGSDDRSSSEITDISNNSSSWLQLKILELSSRMMMEIWKVLDRWWCTKVLARHLSRTLVMDVWLYQILKQDWHCNICSDFDQCEACYEVMDADLQPLG